MKPLPFILVFLLPALMNVLSAQIPDSVQSALVGKWKERPEPGAPPKPSFVPDIYLQIISLQNTAKDGHFTFDGSFNDMQINDANVHYNAGEIAIGFTYQYGLNPKTKKSMTMYCSGILANGTLRLIGFAPEEPERPFGFNFWIRA